MTGGPVQTLTRLSRLPVERRRFVIRLAHRLNDGEITETELLEKLGDYCREQFA